MVAAVRTGAAVAAAGARIAVARRTVRAGITPEQITRIHRLQDYTEVWDGLVGRLARHYHAGMSRCSIALSILLSLAMVQGLEAQARVAQPAVPSREAVVTAARTVIAKARYATFTTLDERGAPQARIVDPFAPEGELTIWVGTNSRSRKVGQVSRDGRVTLTYFDRDGQHYVTIVGTATIVRDLAAREAHWKDEWKAFYPNGFRGDEYLLIRVDPIQLEVVAPGLGMNNDPVTWRPVTVDMRRSQRE